MIKRIYESMNKTYLTEKCNLLTLKHLIRNFLTFPGIFWILIFTCWKMVIVHQWLYYLPWNKVSVRKFRGDLVSRALNVCPFIISLCSKPSTFLMQLMYSVSDHLKWRLVPQVRKLCNVITHNIIWAIQNTESFCVSLATLICTVWRNVSVIK